MATQGYKMDNAKISMNDVEIFQTSRKRTGAHSGDKFQVLECSETNLKKPVHLEKYSRQRKELFEKGDIVQQGDKYNLKVTLEFNTPSGASDFVLDGSTNGWSEWKNKDGKTLDEV